MDVCSHILRNLEHANTARETSVTPEEAGVSFPDV